MLNYRSAALTLAACAAGLSLAACTAGITTASSPTSAPAPTRSTSVAAAASSRAPSGRMISVSAPVGRFPVPAGAKVAENIAVDQKDIVVAFGSVTPANVSSFYAAALPQAGFAVSGNSVVTEDGSTVAFIEFSGHGYKGTVSTLSKVPSDASVPGLGTKNVTTITFTLK